MHEVGTPGLFWWIQTATERAPGGCVSWSASREERIVGQLWTIVKWLFGIGVVLVLIFGGAAAFLAPTIKEAIDKQRESQMGTIVQVEDAGMGDLVRSVSAPGSVAAREVVHITPRVSAKIIRMPFDIGDSVNEGDVIVELDSKDLAAALAASEARLLAEEASLKSVEANYASERAAILGLKAQLDRATADLERAQSLFKTGDISKQELDGAVADRDRLQADYEARQAGLDGTAARVDAARAGVQVAQADVDRSKENLEFTIIRAPMDGVVMSRPSRVGEVVLGTVQNMGTVIMVIADLSEMLVNVRVPEVDVPRVEIGQRARILINGYGSREFTGTIRRVALQSSIGTDGTNSYETEIVLDLPEGDRISAGLTANADIEVETISNVVTIPSQAVLDKRVEDLPREMRASNELVDLNRTFTQIVFTLDENNKASMKPVRVVASNLVASAIEAGIDPDERVIIGPFRSLQILTDGMGVRVEGEEDEEDNAEGEDSESNDDAEVEETDQEPSGDDSDGSETTTTE